MPGPIPNRSEDIAHARNLNRAGRVTISKGQMMPTTVPEANPEWLPVCRMIWDAAATSGGSSFYQNSDWAMLYSLLDDLDSAKRQGVYYEKDEAGKYLLDENGERIVAFKKLPAVLLATIYSKLDSLLLTEGDRRRARIELESTVDPTISTGKATVSDLRNRLGKGA